MKPEQLQPGTRIYYSGDMATMETARRCTLKGSKDSYSERDIMGIKKQKRKHRRIVTDCYRCPLSAVKDGVQAYCGWTDKVVYTHKKISIGMENKPWLQQPEHCPLRSGPITIIFGG